jgi:hypothetical protein
VTAPLPIDRLYSIGVVSDDLDKTLAELARFFGIATWEVRRLKSGSGFSLERRGALIDAELLLATGSSSNVRFDVICPVQGTTIFSEWLAQRGPGMHDLATHVLTREAFEEALGGLGREGIGVLQSMRVGDELEVHYLDSAPQLGTVVRILVPLRAGGSDLTQVPVERTLKFDVGAPHERLEIEAPYHVCINTKHRRSSVREAFERIFGIERWFEYDNESKVSVEHDHYLGRPADARFRLTCGRREDFSVEVVEMMFGDSVYEDMLRERGEGIHHVFTTVCTREELERVSAALADSGYSIVQDGCVGDIYYGYLAAPGRMADLAVEMLCPMAPNWTREAGDEFWKILMGENYRSHRLVAG